MMVVAVMAEALHLLSRYGQRPFGVKWFVAAGREQAENEYVRSRTRFAVAPIAILTVFMACALPAARALAQSGSTQFTPKPKPVPPPEARVDINHATLDELAKIPGLTPSWAGRIVRFRPYRTKQDLVEHGVLPSDVYDRIKDSIIAHRGEQ